MEEWSEFFINATCVDMTRFAKLKTLDLTILAFQGPAFDPDDGRSYDARRFNGCDPALPRLVDMLPASLKTFRLYVGQLNEDDALICLRRLFAFTSQEQAEKLPNWKEMVIVKTEYMRDQVDPYLELVKSEFNNGPEFSFTIRTLEDGEPIGAVYSEGRQ